MRAAAPVTALAIAATLAACASVMRGTSEQVQFMSDPSGAQAQTTLGLACLTPCVLQVGRHDVFQVTFTKDGYHPQTVKVRKQISGQGAGAFAGNVILGGAVGMVTDVVTGAGLDHCPNPVIVYLTPLKKREKPTFPAPVADPCEPPPIVETPDVAMY